MGFFSKLRGDSTRNNGLEHVEPVIHASTDSLPDPATQGRTQTKSKTWATTATTITHIPSWPHEAQPLKKHTWITYTYMIGDLIMVLLPLYFILLGVAVIKLNGKPTKDNAFGTKVETAIDLGPTLFPIIFAAVCGRSMKMIARYVAERSVKLGTLELLMASQSVWGAVESQVLMRRLTLVGANLLFLWTLSPLGGQASLRLMSRGNREAFSITKLRYLTTGPGATAWGISSTYSGNGRFSDAGALYTAALMAPQSTKLGPRDSWGNVKIPSLRSLNDSHIDSNGWITVPSRITAPEVYSSLVGLPIVGLPLNATSNFTMESTYISVECGDFTQIPFPGINGSSNFQQANYTKLDELFPGQIWTNKSANDPFGVVGRRASFFIDTNRSFAFGEDDDPEHQALLGRLDGFFGHINQSRLSEEESGEKREIQYVSLYATSEDLSTFGLNIANCSLSQDHIEAMIQCDKDQCIASKVRKSLSDDRLTTFTGFEHGLVMSGVAQEFPKAVNFAIGSAVGSSPTEHFFVNSSSFPFVQRVGGSLSQEVVYANVSTVPVDVFSKRLTLMLNTYYQLSMQPTGYWGGLSNNLTAYGPDTLPVTDINVYLPANLTATDNSFYEWWSVFDQTTQNIDSPFIGATTSANVTSSQEIFNCQWQWLALLFTSSTTIFIVGVIALILKRGTLGPELFGFVTSMSYENPYVRIPNGGSTLDAMERARLLKDVEVCIGDVHGDKDIGHIALAAGVPARKLERGRLYT